MNYKSNKFELRATPSGNGKITINIDYDAWKIIKGWQKSCKMSVPALVAEAIRYSDAHLSVVPVDDSEINDEVEED